MSDKLKKTLIGALISVALAAAVSYGLINQETADTVRTKTDQMLSDWPSTPPNTGGSGPGEPTPPNTDPRPPAPQQPAPR